MATIRVDWDEWYPVYFVVGEGYDNSEYGDEFEVSEEDLAFIRKATSDFNDAQRILAKLVHPNGR